jgi:transcriptional regulator with XRE-family HTH domain
MDGMTHTLIIMTPGDFKAWRERMDLSQPAAADALGIARSTVQMYELGHRKDDHGREVIIPKPIRLACAALEKGILDYSGV